jgi:hypothetical protein
VGPRRSARKELERVGTLNNVPLSFDDEEGSNHPPPEEGFELYRHKDAQKMRTKNWRGYYWTRRTEQGDYEIRSVPSSLGEHSVPGGVMPKEGFEEHYERAAPGT